MALSSEILVQHRDALVVQLELPAVVSEEEQLRLRQGLPCGFPRPVGRVIARQSDRTGQSAKVQKSRRRPKNMNRSRMALSRFRMR
jgi:hypothetical protein